MKDGIVTGRVSGRAVSIESIALMITAVVLLAPTALGAGRYGATGIGTTSINTSTCDADVTSPLPVYVDVNNGDSVTVYLNYTYSDSRLPRLYPAVHAFVMTTVYLYTSWSDGVNVTTYGGESGDGSLQRTVPNVSENTWIWVRWQAQISSVSNPVCFASDEKDGYIYLT